MDLAALADRLEAISVGYASREGIDRDDDWFLLKLQEELGELTQVQLGRTGRSKPRGFTPAQLNGKLAVGPRARRGPAAARSDVVGRAWGECADVLGHILLFARRNGVDLAAALDAKWLSWERSPRG